MADIINDLEIVKRRIERLYGFGEEAEVIDNVISLLKAQERKWIPFVKRPLTEEEQKNHPDWCFILDGEVPEDGQEILLYRPWKNKDGYIIVMDTYLDNGDEVYLEGAMDIENGMYWMPLPEPYHKDTDADCAREGRNLNE